MPTLDVDNVCTHANLVSELHSDRALRELLPRDAAGNSKPIREAAYADALRALARRAPPILESDLSDPTELSAAVVYGTLMRLYRANFTTGTDGDVHYAKWKMYRDLFEEEIGGVNLTVDGGSIGAPSSFSFERR